MSPVYDPYSEIQQDLDQFGLYSCNISYQDYLPSQFNNFNYNSENNDPGSIDTIIVESNQTNIYITNYVNEYEKIIIQKILRRFPNNLIYRIQNGSKAIQLSIQLYNEIWNKREFIPNNIIIQQINRLITSTNCYFLLNQLNLIETNLNTINNLLNSIQNIEFETGISTINQKIQIINEKYNNLKINQQRNNGEKQKLNRLTRRKIATNKKSNK